MKYFILIAILSVLLFTMFPSNKSVAKFNIGQPESSYIENVQNLTTSVELQNFFEAQSAIYIDNVYGIMQRFFYKLLSELPKCKRADEIKSMVGQMERFLEVENVPKKFAIFERFADKFSVKYDAIFEYVADDTHLSAKEFNDLYVGSGVDEVLSYANIAQLEAFVEHTGNGIRAYLIHNRARLDQPSMMRFKTVVDAFLERQTFVEKLVSLKLFLSTSRDVLE